MTLAQNDAPAHKKFVEKKKKKKKKDQPFRRYWPEDKCNGQTNISTRWFQHASPPPKKKQPKKNTTMFLIKTEEEEEKKRTQQQCCKPTNLSPYPPNPPSCPQAAPFPEVPLASSMGQDWQEGSHRWQHLTGLPTSCPPSSTQTWERWGCWFGTEHRSLLVATAWRRGRRGNWGWGRGRLRCLSLRWWELAFHCTSNTGH